ncbi:iron permease [Vespertiliibacter pulmonis]|uniref:High-affinity iron transporter n=1 Tax=Vespertiliibacter pulmonis TaxID=1443036 RepID=A0A3N4WJ08_9PAST|nr:FTR1 family protein [Vespertiliibacter pulmonis]QLB21474.1 iron permease [Vespertiliibacter pulmonis]RPE85890.1 high-affinity iron transporter [Vespertiliibacter pulmonis]
MKMITWVKPCLIKFNYFLALFTLSITLSVCAYAKVETSSLFVHLSDAMEEVKKGEITKSEPYLTALQQEFEAIPSHNSDAGKAVKSALDVATTNTSLPHLEQLAKALYLFEKEQNPVDYAQQRQKFAKRVLPIYQQLENAIYSADLTQIETVFKQFNTIWSANEKVVRETSLGHYGQIETAMTLLRIAMLSEPANFTEMQKQVSVLGNALADFKAGNVLQPQVANNGADAPQTLPSGIKLLEKSYAKFENNQIEQAKADITLFIQQWPVFEGDVRTRDGALYTRVESDLPVIMVKGNEPANMQKFQKMIDDLNHLDITGSYGIIDAMLVLLREGVEALLIIMALLTTLNATNQPRAKRWVYAGAGLGLGASIIGAVALQQLFPAISAGTHREVLEGAVGVIAVVIMLFVGAWLHSKSSMQGWKKFIDKKVANALVAGSLIPMLSLSFLSVFREGAETILFYAGMLPLISTQDLMIGLGLAIALLGIIALIMSFSSKRLPMHRLFKVMTLLIYGLGFKILGVSIHALQLTQIIPRHLIDLPNIEIIGFYASLEGIISQIIYLILIPLIAKIFKN